MNNGCLLILETNIKFQDWTETFTRRRNEKCWENNKKSNDQVLCGWDGNNDAISQRSAFQIGCYLVLRILPLPRVCVFIVLDHLVGIEAFDLSLNYLCPDKKGNYEGEADSLLEFNYEFTSRETKHSSGNVNKMLTQNRTLAKFISS